MKKDLVVKDNALINASYNLDLVEQRLILLAIIDARESSTPTDKDLTIHVDNYINYFSVHRNTAYQALKDACRSLFDRRFSYQKLTSKGNIENVISRWVQRVSYVENEALVRIRFSDDVIPLITSLEKHFTSYELEQVSGLSSAYAVRLYEILIAWRSTGKVPMIELREFRNRLGVAVSEYSKMVNFKTRVLDLAINQINEHTDITASYEQHKQGRTIVGFSFKFKQKKKKQDVPTDTGTSDKDTIDMFCNLSDAQIKLYSSILSKLHSISDLAGEKGYRAFESFLADVLRNPTRVREETAKRIFKALRTETDFRNQSK